MATNYPLVGILNAADHVFAMLVPSCREWNDLWYTNRGRFIHVQSDDRDSAGNNNTFTYLVTVLPGDEVIVPELIDPDLQEALAAVKAVGLRL